VGGEPLKVAVAGKQVQITGKCLRASADHVCWSAGHGDILLDGSVKLRFDADAHKAEVTAAQVVVGVADGRIEVYGAGNLVRQPAPAATCPVSLDFGFPVAHPPAEQQQLFDFWMGLVR
jgi:hypothetical protein